MVEIFVMLSVVFCTVCIQCYLFKSKRQNAMNAHSPMSWFVYMARSNLVNRLMRALPNPPLPFPSNSSYTQRAVLLVKTILGFPLGQVNGRILRAELASLVLAVCRFYVVGDEGCELVFEKASTTLFSF